MSYIIDEKTLWQIVVDANFATTPGEYYKELINSKKLEPTPETVNKTEGENKVDILADKLWEQFGFVLSAAFTKQTFTDKLKDL